MSTSARHPAFQKSGHNGNNLTDHEASLQNRQLGTCVRCGRPLVHRVDRQRSPLHRGAAFCESPDYIEGRRRTRAHFLLMSDRRGIVFDLFVRQLPPEKAPGPPWSDETQRWLKPRAERAAAAYARHLGFEKGIEHRHGQYLNEPLDNCLAFLPDRGRHSRTQTSQTNPQI